MSKWLQKKAAAIALVCMICGALSGYASVTLDRGSSCGQDAIAVYVNDVLEYTGYRIQGREYVPLRSFCGSLDLGAVITWGGESEPMVVRFQTTDHREHVLSARVGDFYLLVDERIVYLDGDVLLSGGNVLVPLDGLCRAFGVTASADGFRQGLVLDTEELRVCQSGSETYDAEDLKWLSHIINAEAGNQSIEGQICVGNVVLNRVKHDAFPDSVRDVVFSPGQFCPVASGTIYSTPDADAVAAAKLCLEGLNLAGESTYFVNPVTGSTRWFRENLTYVMSVGDHDFYF